MPYRISKAENQRMEIPMKRVKKRNFTHLLIKQTAIEFAGEFYEEAAHDNLFYKYYPNLEFFVRREWPKFVDVARKYLIELLGRNDISDYMKEHIYEAVLKERTLPAGDTAVMPSNVLY